MNKYVKWINFTILGILSVAPVMIVIYTMFSFIGIVSGNNICAELNPESLNYCKMISFNGVYVMAIYYFLHIAISKRYHPVTSAAWMILLLIPRLNIFFVPAFWVYLVVKEITVSREKVERRQEEKLIDSTL